MLLVLAAVVVGLSLGAQMAQRQAQMIEPSRVGGPIPRPPAAPQPLPDAARPGQGAVAVEARQALAPADRYPLTAWDIDGTRAGYIEHVSIAGPEPRPLGSLRADDVLLVTGWAGDAEFGMRYSHVLLVSCSQVVGIAAVDQPRPDIAATVHPRLGSSGWSALLPAALLPRCDDATLKAWAVRDARYAYPLEGGVVLSLPPEATPPEVIAAPPVVRPGSLPPVRTGTVEVTVAAANLRRCSSTDCAIVGAIDGGRHPVAVLERDGGWYLLLTRSVIGWVAGDLFHFVEPGSEPPPEPVKPKAEAAATAAAPADSPPPPPAMPEDHP